MAVCMRKYASAHPSIPEPSALECSAVPKLLSDTKGEAKSRNGDRH